MVWLRDERKRVRKHDDVVLELLLDADRDGVYLTLAIDWGFEVGLVARPAARRYAEVRRAALQPILTRLQQEGFELEVSPMYMPIGDHEDAWGVVLASRFYGRRDLCEDAPLVAGIRTLVAAYDEIYKGGLAHPTSDERSYLA